MTLINLSLYFFASFSFLYFYGRGIFEIYFYLLKKRYSVLFDTDIAYFFPGTGLFFVGNLAFFLNYFLPLNSLLSYLIIAFPLLGNLIYLRLLKVKINHFIFLFFTPLIASFFNNNVADDALWYHFVSQNFIRNEKIIFGLSNFSSRYGVNSINEYLSSLLWVNESYIYTHFVSIMFIAIFYYLLYGFYQSRNILLRNISVVVIIISIFDNFGYTGGRNGYIYIQEIGKFDASFGILFFISYILFLVTLKKHNLEKIEIHLLVNTLLFAGQIRPMGFLLFIPGLIVCLKLLKKEDYKVFLKNYVFIFFGIFWILKNIINTSCLIYPVSFTCIQSLPWNFPGQAELLSSGIVANNRNPNTDFNAINNFDWIIDYWISANYGYLFNVLITFFSLLIILTLFRNKNYKMSKLNIYEQLLLLSSVIFLGLWFFYYPNYRFSTGSFLSLYIVFLYKYVQVESTLLKKIYSKNLLFLMLLSLSVGLVVRADSYLYMARNLNIDLENYHTTQYQEYESRVNSYGVKPINNHHCYDNTECSVSEQEVDIKYFLSYKFFIPQNLEYNIKKLNEIYNN
tara:strand:- start:4490 stop:6193 length:1704 start_codon:yes stop_codon:yes gene_type:complete